ncbi:hypothetical protein FZEAL_9105 [Fusarium zealandicum]|uniref:Uncharacterized protein n=1 Tax=Fusarium zealandicum TaxID=1053134 RepID=A0A8H4UCY7_9HYPO|nr:hypothetical protein FZEAL_9105 [Fusarium zealandicum]
MLGPAMLQNGFSKLLAALFCLLAAVNYSIAAPHNRDLAVREEGRLSTRAGTPEVKWFHEKLKTSTLFREEETVFIDFRDGPKSYASGAFGGCIALIIATKQGAIAGHYTATKTGVEKAAEDFKKLYEDDDKKDLLEDATPHIYYMIQNPSEGDIHAEEVVKEHIEMLEDLTDNDVVHHDYMESVYAYVDEDLEEIQGWDRENILSGAVVIENEGGGDKDTKLSFVTQQLIRDSARPN